MRIVIPGGTGQVGTLLARAFHRDGHDVIALGRSPVEAPWRIVRWDPQRLGDWARSIDGADAVINMAGGAGAGRQETKNKTRHRRPPPVPSPFSKKNPTRYAASSASPARARPGQGTAPQT